MERVGGLYTVQLAEVYQDPIIILFVQEGTTAKCAIPTVL